MPKEIIRSLQVMEEQRQQHPNTPMYDLDDFQQKRASNILKCFQQAIDLNGLRKSQKYLNTISMV